LSEISGEIAETPGIGAETEEHDLVLRLQRPESGLRGILQLFLIKGFPGRRNCFLAELESFALASFLGIASVLNPRRFRVILPSPAL
jgi:hypothetical protein